MHCLWGMTDAPAIAHRISYRIAFLVWRCLLGSAPAYLCELCRPVSSLSGQRVLRSSVICQLLVGYIVLQLQLCSVGHSPLLVPSPGTDSLWKSASCLKIMKMRSTGCD